MNKSIAIFVVMACVVSTCFAEPDPHHKLKGFYPVGYGVPAAYPVAYPVAVPRPVPVPVPVAIPYAAPVAVAPIVPVAPIYGFGWVNGLMFASFASEIISFFFLFQKIREIRKIPQIRKMKFPQKNIS